MSDTLELLRELIDMEIIAETSLELNSEEIYALRELFADVERLNKALDEIANFRNGGDSWWAVAQELQAIARAAREVRDVN